MVAGAGSVRPMSIVFSPNYLETQMSTIEKHLRVCIFFCIFFSFFLYEVTLAIYIFVDLLSSIE